MAALRSSDLPADIKPVFLLSSCLAGIDCTYNGDSKVDQSLKRLVDRRMAIAICPEMLGGSPARRPQCEISCGDGHDVIAGKAKVITKEGRDISARMIKGAERSLAAARRFGIEKAILKSKSPSCGNGTIYDGTFRNKLKSGDGVTAALFKENGIQVSDERGSAAWLAKFSL